MKMHFLRNSVMLGAAALLLFTGCSTYSPVFVVTLHEFSDINTATHLNRTVKDTEQVYSHQVKNFPFLDARSFVSGEVTGPNDKGMYGVRLIVERWSIGSMQQTAGECLGQVYAVVVDGSYMGYSHFDKLMRDTNTCEIEPIFSQYDAQMIVDHIERNYKHFNHWVKEPF